MLNDSLRNSKILIIDDQAATVLLVEKTLRQAGYANCKSITDSRQAIPVFDEFQPDLIILDLRMPGLDGYDVLRHLRLRIPQQSYLPIVILTADLSQAAKRKALSLGAKDFITKPFDHAEIVLRINGLLEARLQHCALEEQNEGLEQKVRERTRDLEEAQVELMQRLALAAEYRDDATGQHTQRVGELAALLSRSVDCPQQRVEFIRQAAPLHDLGKIGVPDSILLKPGKLTPEEYELIKTHTTIGARLLSDSKFPVLQLAEMIAWYHHEHWNGAGYWGLQGETIPLEARIVSIADTFDVLTHDRPYKKACSGDEAIAEIKSQSGLQFDPRLVQKFIELVRSNGVEALRAAVGHQQYLGRGQIDNTCLHTEVLTRLTLDHRESSERLA